ncbi:MAG TPA: cysteine--tRNA ligase [Actinomycetota bacterium]|nr:cysteine--tRNA ligase [Actinomycetota bacterium]
MHDIHLTDTLSGRKARFEPVVPGRVGIYLCGPTVYDVPHVGHARAAVAFDVLRRHLHWRGLEVVFVRNVTDVDDRIIATSNQTGLDAMAVAEKFTRAYDDAMTSLCVLPPDIAPRATGHLLEMQEMIAQLIDSGVAYAVDGNVWFSVESAEGYGKLSRRSLDDLRAGERVEPDPGKRNPLDFSLWKAAKPGEPSWPSPWGPGRPGWHIECSAMAVRYLGMPFDIHAGGIDLIFPHHENEIAQAESAVGREPFARWWLHNGHVQISGEKMSKSLKNYVRVDDVLQDYPPQVLRLFYLSAHYRSPIAYSPDGLDEAQSVWDRFRGFLRTGPAGTGATAALDRFGAAMDDDLNTPEAIAALHAIVTEGNRALESGDAGAASGLRGALTEGLGVLGCGTENRTDATNVIGPLVELLLEQRERARQARDFAAADAIRSRLDEIGVQVEDSAEGPRWYLR